MQLTAMVKGMDIADRQATGTVRVAHLTVNASCTAASRSPWSSPRRASSAIMGIGQALLEATATDRTTARILNPGLNEYLIPAHADVPVIDVAFVEDRDDQINVLGVKGLGELPATGVAPAIANAVHHATGRRIRDLPIRPEMLL
jgi:xanthine dehydrogenase YagR molybdenum-binding subunit